MGLLGGPDYLLSGRAQRAGGCRKILVLVWISAVMDRRYTLN